MSHEKAELESRIRLECDAADKLFYAGFGRTAAIRPLVERIVELETNVADHTKIEAALRAQISALEAIAHNQETAIADACADVRAETARELASTRTALERAVLKIARLETTIETLMAMAGKRGN